MATCQSTNRTTSVDDEDRLLTIHVGVLALQGAFEEHLSHLRSLDSRIRVSEIRRPEELDGLDGLVIPGGESTAFAIIGKRIGMFEALKAWRKKMNRPMWGTCAGLIVLANNVDKQKKGGQALVGGLDVRVARNFFGSQLNSFESDIDPPPSTSSPSSSRTDGDDDDGGRKTKKQKATHDDPFRGVFIRAPAVVETGPDVQVLSRVNVSGKSSIVAVQQGRLMATAFHPELTNDNRYHGYFVDMVRDAKRKDGGD